MAGAGAVRNAPIVIDVGRASRRNVRQLASGTGRLAADVDDALSDVTASLGEEAEGKQLIPVVLVYRRKPRRRRGGGGGGGRGNLFFPPFW